MSAPSDSEPDDAPRSDQDGNIAPSRVGCASPPNNVENVDVSPSREPSTDDCYTDLLHSRAIASGLSRSPRSGNGGRGCVLAGRGHRLREQVGQVETGVIDLRYRLGQDR